MGQASCCSLRPKVGFDETRDKAIIDTDLRKVLSYDFNMGVGIKTTLEESLMTEITNDIGEPISPPTTQVLMLEFKKFMFLCKMNIQECQRAKVTCSENYIPKDSSK